MGSFFIHFVTFTSTLVYSATYNQSGSPWVIPGELSMNYPGMWNHQRIIGEFLGNSLVMGNHKGIISTFPGNFLGMGNNWVIPGGLPGKSPMHSALVPHRGSTGIP